MAEQQAQTDASEDRTARLPVVRTDHRPEAVQASLDEAARRGRLAGYQRVDGATFAFDGAGWLFEYSATGRIAADGTISFDMKRQRKGVIILALVLAFLIEPGQYFTDQLIPGTWGWWPTWWWYYPLTILSIPFVWLAASKQSKSAALAYTGGQIESIAAATRGTIEPA